jgi:hypothetical protein
MTPNIVTCSDRMTPNIVICSDRITPNIVICFDRITPNIVIYTAIVLFEQSKCVDSIQFTSDKHLGHAYLTWLTGLLFFTFEGYFRYECKQTVHIVQQRVGEKKLASIMKTMKQKAGLDTNKHLTNHSARKWFGTKAERQ